MLVITSISRRLYLGWVVDRMPGLSIVYVSIGQLEEDSADMPGVVQGVGHLPAVIYTVILRDWQGGGHAERVRALRQVGGHQSPL